MRRIGIGFELGYEQDLVMMNAWKEIDTYGVFQKVGLSRGIESPCLWKQEWRDDEEALDPRTCRWWFEI